MEKTATPSIKPVVWIGSSRADLASFPEDVKDAIGYALYIAQRGGKHPDAKPLRGFGSSGLLEIVEDHAGATYRGVYTVSLCGTDIRLARIPEEIEDWNQDTETRD